MNAICVRHSSMSGNNCHASLFLRSRHSSFLTSAACRSSLHRATIFRKKPGVSTRTLGFYIGLSSRMPGFFRIHNSYFLPECQDSFKCRESPSKFHEFFPTNINRKNLLRFVKFSKFMISEEFSKKKLHNL